MFGQERPPGPTGGGCLGASGRWAGSRGEESPWRGTGGGETGGSQVPRLGVGQRWFLSCRQDVPGQSWRTQDLGGAVEWGHR